MWPWRWERDSLSVSASWVSDYLSQSLRRPRRPLLQPAESVTICFRVSTSLRALGTGPRPSQWLSDFESLPGPQAGARGRRANLPTSSCLCSQAGPGVPQRQQAGHSECTGASSTGRLLVTLHITIYTVRILITLFKTYHLCYVTYNLCYISQPKAATWLIMSPIFT